MATNNRIYGDLAVTGTNLTLNGVAVSNNSSSATLTNKTIDAASNTISNIANANISASAAIVESKLSLDYSTSSLHTLAAAALPSASFTDSAVSSKLITGFVSGAGTVAATDSILQAIQKLDGNVAGKQASLGFTPENSANKGAAGGYASLDGGGKVPVSQLPNSVMEFQGAWDASNNTPTLADGTGNAGDVYRVSVAGSQNLGSGAQSFGVGDWVMYSGSIWQHSPATDAVTSVNGYTGAVSLTKSDVGLGNVDNTSDATKNSASATLTNKTIDAASNTISNIANSNISASAAIVESKLSLDYSTSSLNTAIGTKLNSSAFTDAAVTGKLITGFVSGAGTVAATDSILQAIQKLDGNVAGKVSTSTTVNGYALSSNVTLTKSDVGLGNVDNVQQLPMSYLDTDNTLAADSDSKVPSQKAIKAYVDGHSGSASSALDGTFTINNTATPSKKIAFSAAAISASTTRTLSMPDANVDLGALVNANISASAAIVESKLSLDYSTSSLNTAIGNKLNKVSGDIEETSFSASGSVASPANVTGFAFANASVRAFDAIIDVVNATSGLYEVFSIRGIQKGSSWDLGIQSSGDVSGVSFSITNAGQITYINSDTNGAIFKFRARVLSL